MTATITEATRAQIRPYLVHIPGGEGGVVKVTASSPAQAVAASGADRIPGAADQPYAHRPGNCGYCDRAVAAVAEQASR